MGERQLTVELERTEINFFQVAQSEAERESESLTEDLLSGKVTNVDEFMEQFMVSSRVGASCTSKLYGFPF